MNEIPVNFENDNILDPKTFSVFSGTDDDENYIPNSESESSTSSLPFTVTKTRQKSVVIPESPETCNSDLTVIKKTRSRKRVRNPAQWKCNVRRINAVSGKAYESKKGKAVPEKKIKESCNPCKKKCSIKIDSKTRNEIFNKYWSPEMSWDTKRQYIISRVSKKPVERLRPKENENPKRKRTCTLQYTFAIDNQCVVVCKNFFLNTLSISETVVRNALKNQTHGIVETDRRGRHEPRNKISEEIKENIRNHIRKLPKYESHYSREKTNRKYLGNHLNVEVLYKLYKEDCELLKLDPKFIAKNWLYRHIFNTEFNLGFRLPENDTCDTCDSYTIKIRELNDGPERDELKIKYDAHLDDATQRYNLKKIDKTHCKENKSHCIMLTVDLQKCLATPLLTNGQSFYLRKLWTFNYTIMNGDKCTCIMWDETKSGRGGNEMASGILKWCELNILNTDINEITIWSDNCSGQNKNINLIICYLWLLHKFPNLQKINHKYLLKGHTHMEVDGVHSLIERARKKTPQFTIMTPWDWQQMIRSCSNNSENIEVVNMELHDFKNFLELVEGLSSPFVHRQKSNSGTNVPYSNIVWMQFRKESFGSMHYKCSFEDNDFEEVSLIRKRRISLNDLNIVSDLNQVRNALKPISTAKYNDLQTALQWIPSIFHNFYNNIPHNSNAKDLPEPQD